jgi:hypothetical protein
VPDTATAVELAEEFNVFHQWHVWKTANIEKDISPAENPVIAASHTKQNSCIMRKAVRQSVQNTSR